MKTAIILHNMIVEQRLNGYQSELFGLFKTAAEKGLFLDENGVDK